MTIEVTALSRHTSDTTWQNVTARAVITAASQQLTNCNCLAWLARLHNATGTVQYY
jgi:hypothetical protein